MSGVIEVGTASWTDKSLIASKAFYGRGCNSSEQRLRFYASQFSCVEQDGAFYQLPSARNSSLWAERTPDTFHFNIKAFRLFTGHQTPATSLPAEFVKSLSWYFDRKRNIYYRDMPGELREELWSRFKQGIEPLRAAGKLVAVHFQFPPWVTPDREWYTHIEECAEHLAGFQLATEFRNAKWFDHEHSAGTLAFEQQHNFAHVVLDMPQGFSNSVAPVWQVTSPDLAIFRLHGQNHESWNAKDLEAASDRFDYEYSDAELDAFVPKLRKLAEHASRVMAIVNVNKDDQGTRAAATLKAKLDAE